MPEYATARIGMDGHLLLPKIPGVPASSLESTSEHLELFKTMVSDMMRDISGRAMTDQKDSDVLISNMGSGSELLLPVDFGEFGLYLLMDEVHKVMSSAAPGM